MSDPNPKPKRWLLPALLLSLAANLALGGYLLGREANPGYAPPMGNPLAASGPVGRFVKSLDPERREVLAPLVVEHVRALRKGARGARHAHRELQRALLVEPFDAQRMRAALQQLTAQRDPAVGERVAETYVTLLAAMTAQERKAYAERRRSHRPRMGHRSGHRPETRHR